MNGAALVALSLIAGVFLVVLLGAMGLIIYLMLQVRKTVEEFLQITQATELDHERKLDQFLVEFNAACDSVVDEQREFDAERGRSIASLQSSVGQFRTETRDTLKAHRDAMDQKLEALNAPALLAASSKITAAATQLARTAAAVQSLLLAHEDRDESESGLEDTAYAPVDSTYYAQGSTAYSDERADREGDQAEQEGPATRLPAEEGVLS